MLCQCVPCQNKIPVFAIFRVASCFSMPRGVNWLETSVMDILKRKRRWIIYVTFLWNMVANASALCLAQVLGLYLFQKILSLAVQLSTTTTTADMVEL